MDYETASRLWLYEPHTGLMRHASGEKLGTVVGGENAKSSTYRHVCHAGRYYKFHRIAWLLAHGKPPAHEIDHINGVKSDNRLCNLRDVPHRENQMNQKHHRSGEKKADYRRDIKAGIRDEFGRLRDKQAVTASRAHALYEGSHGVTA